MYAVHSNRRRRRPWWYSATEFVETVSDNDAAFNSDDDIVGEAAYDEECLRRRKQRRKMSSSSEVDDEYRGDEENAEDVEEDDDSVSISEDGDEPQRFKKLPGRTRRETKLRSVDKLQSGLRHSTRASRTSLNYRQYGLSESEAELTKREKSDASGEHRHSETEEFSMGSEDSDAINDNHEKKEVDQPTEEHPETVEKAQDQPPENSNSPGQDETGGVRKRRFLDPNELAPCSGFEDGSSFENGSNTILNVEKTDDL